MKPFVPLFLKTWIWIMGGQQSIVLSEQRIPELQHVEKNEIPAKIRREVWRQWARDGSAACFACDEPLSAERWHCGHITPCSHGGSPRLHNLRPLCPRCNLSMGATHMYEYIIHENLPGKRHIRPSPLYEFYKSKLRIMAQTERDIAGMGLSKKQQTSLLRRLRGKGQRWLEVVELVRTYKSS